MAALSAKGILRALRLLLIFSGRMLTSLMSIWPKSFAALTGKQRHLKLGLVEA